MKTNVLFLTLLTACALPAWVRPYDDAAGTPLDNNLSWPEERITHRPAVYWWWPGSAVDKKNLTRNMEALREAGVGGVGIVPIYGVKGMEDQFIDYLTPEWLEMLDHAVREGNRLGMWVDMTTGTGWPFGGPHVGAEDADARAAFENGEVQTRPSGRKVKRAAPGGVGYAINPFSPAAMTKYLDIFDEALAAHSGKLPRAQYHDSFEYMGNWSNELWGAFEAGRGYDLRPHLPALFGQDDSETVARIKSDYRATLADLHLRTIEIWVDWSHGKGCITRNQAHGAPGNLIDLYATADIPETETFGSTPFRISGLHRDSRDVGRDIPNPLVCRFAASAAHVTGKPLVASETCTWLRDHFKTALSQVKPEVDQLFLAGINHVIFHGCCYSPEEAQWPGWLFYASTQFNPRNAFWHDFPALSAYITRCQSILQSGGPANDILVYWPIHDLWHNAEGMQQQLTVHGTEWFTQSPFGKTAALLAARGYTFDYISDRLLQQVEWDGQRLCTADSQYRVVLVPRCEHMPLAAMTKLIHLASTGVTVLFQQALPADVPGFNDLDNRRKRLKELLGPLDFTPTSEPGIREAAVGKGRFLLGDASETMLNRIGIQRETLVDSGLEFIRRTHEEGFHYFLANLGPDLIDGWIPLSVPVRSAVLLDPLSGKAGLLSTRHRDGLSEIYLQVPSGASLVIRTLSKSEASGNEWPYVQPAGDPIEIKGEWHVEFLSGGPELPRPYTTNSLASWTSCEEDVYKWFSGTARYSIEFERPEAGADEWVLDLGRVCESARIRINGQDGGILWSLPFRRPVGRLVREGKNVLEVEVTNLSANRIRDHDIRKVPWKKFHDINFVNIHYRPFDASTRDLMDSGLLGPVRLMPMKRIHPGKR